MTRTQVGLEMLEALIAAALQAHRTSPEAARSVARALTLAEADGQAGHGLSRVPAYAAQASSGNWIHGIRRPTLLVNAANDPFLGEACYPYDMANENEFFHLEVPEKGGHVGFSRRINGITWGEKRALEFVKENCGC